MNRKSQITMLMIIGLVLFIVISLVLYLAKSSVKKQSQQSTKKLHETAIEMQPVKEFIIKCLDKTAKDAVLLLGRQGGYIYSSQGGTLVDYVDTDEGLFFIKYNNFNAAYDIMPPRFAAPPYSSDAPDYPWQTFPYRTATSNAEIFEGFFGISNLPPLNASEGPNSIQTQLEAFIDNNIASCFDFSAFKEQGLEISAGQAKTSVVIGNGEVSVKSKIPITINNPSAKESAEFSDFSANLNIRLKDIYFFIKDLVENDVKDIKFDIGNINNSKGFMHIKLIKNAFSGDDIVIVTDEKSFVQGNLYEFVFSRRNRAPALYYIRKNVLEFPQGYEINETDLLQNSPLKAEDPDEDNYTFNIFKGEFGKSLAEFPIESNQPQIKFRIEASDGRLTDYQTITVNRKD